MSFRAQPLVCRPCRIYSSASTRPLARRIYSSATTCLMHATRSSYHGYGFDAIGES
ncbi:hypothetical protein OG21DRAFT_1508099 [Imleria badia]|nr:hypothetical protein OG21DRAFT_1508099 [Imleria badia]